MYGTFDTRLQNLKSDVKLHDITDLHRIQSDPEYRLSSLTNLNKSPKLGFVTVTQTQILGLRSSYPDPELICPTNTTVYDTNLPT